MARNNEIIEDILDNVDDHEKRLTTVENGINQILELLKGNGGESPSQKIIQPFSAQVKVEYKDLKDAVYDGMADYYKAQPDHTGILTEDNLRRIHNIYWCIYNRVTQEHWDKVEKEEKEAAELLEMQRTKQGLQTMGQVAEWTSDYPVEIQRIIRYIGLNVVPEEEPVESAHRIMRVWGDALMQITNKAEPTPPTLKAWLLHRRKLFKSRNGKRKGFFYALLLLLGMTTIVCLCEYQKMVMDLDRTNRIFYYNVIRNEQRSKDYHEIDSLIHSNSFFKTYRTLDK